MSSRTSTRAARQGPRGTSPRREASGDGDAEWRTGAILKRAARHRTTGQQRDQQPRVALTQRGELKATLTCRAAARSTLARMRRRLPPLSAAARARRRRRRRPCRARAAAVTGVGCRCQLWFVTATPLPCSSGGARREHPSRFEHLHGGRRAEHPRFERMHSARRAARGDRGGRHRSPLFHVVCTPPPVRSIADAASTGYNNDKKGPTTTATTTAAATAAAAAAATAAMTKRRRNDDDDETTTTLRLHKADRIERAGEREARRLRQRHAHFYAARPLQSRRGRHEESARSARRRNKERKK